MGLKHRQIGLTGILTNFFFNDTATTEIYTLSLHDALPISRAQSVRPLRRKQNISRANSYAHARYFRSEEHTSELQSQSNLVCRLLLEKKQVSIGAYRLPDPAYRDRGLPASQTLARRAHTAL